MRRWRHLGFGLTALAVVMTVSGVTLHAKRADDHQEEYYKQADLFVDALEIIRSDYVEEPAPQQLIYGALKGMLATLDPYSQFLDPDSYNELKIDTEGQFGGLGIEITIKDDLLTVIAPIDDTPAHRAGLKPNDHIVKIDGDSTRGITLLEAVKKLRGKPNTTVKLTILREDERELIDVTVTRDLIKIESVKDVKVFEGRIGYVRVSDFREKTPQDLEAALERLKQQEIAGLIIDLRNNPGGLLDVAVSVADLFLERNQLVVTTKGRLKAQNLEFYSRRNGALDGVPLVVMINEGSASASEILAGAIQDHRRGIILGVKSHGKASVQTIFPLRDGSALRLTTSKYFTPNGRMIHEQGILPDVEVPFEPPPEREESGKQKTKEIFETVEHPEQGEAPAAPVLDSQLARAVDLLKGIRVYQAARQDPS